MKFKIDIDIEKRRFKEHLENNNRIIFSAPFGTGKTYFLNEFTTDVKANYHTIKLYPVNYSIATNEDIFQLIKIDILMSLLATEDLEIDEEEISKALAIQFYLLNPDEKTFNSILKLLSKVGIGVFEKGYEVFKLKDSFDKYTEKINNTNGNLIKEFIEDEINRKGSIYEEDSITLLIKNIINQLKNKSNGTINFVLLIDDLDRIDPEHIFRLLNVFAAHFDITANENKFDFDKVVFVCDIENIRNIFHSKYGEQVDFSGYIDKFYSSEIFVFENSLAIDLFVSNQIFPNCIYRGEQCFRDRDGFVSISVFYILKCFIKAGVINLRALLKSLRKPYILNEREIHLGGKYKKTSSLTMEGVILIEYLIFLAGDLEGLKRMIINLKENKSNSILIDKYDENNFFKLEELFAVLFYERIQNENSADAKSAQILHPNSGSSIRYTIEEQHRHKRLNIVGIEDYGPLPGPKKYKLNYFEILYEAIEHLQSMRIIK